MIKRTVEISKPAYVRLSNHQLCIDLNGTNVGSIPIEDMGFLILNHPQITITQRALVECSNNNVVIVNCDRQHLPVSTTLPLYSHSTHTKILREQCAISVIRKKQLWKCIVQSKICEQADTLKRVEVEYKPVLNLRNCVKSGDVTNVEAQAAKRYWRLLLGNSFRRIHTATGINAQLNYGYAIVRALVARSLVGSGMHPAIGLNHHNQYNPYCLADDVMEPFRPWVDEIVTTLAKEGCDEICTESKKALLSILDMPVIYEHERTPMMVAVGLLAARIKTAYADKSVLIQYPTRLVGSL